MKLVSSIWYVDEYLFDDRSDILCMSFGLQLSLVLTWKKLLVEVITLSYSSYVQSFEKHMKMDPDPTHIAN